MAGSTSVGRPCFFTLLSNCPHQFNPYRPCPFLLLSFIKFTNCLDIVPLEPEQLENEEGHEMLGKVIFRQGPTILQASLDEETSWHCPDAQTENFLNQSFRWAVGCGMEEAP